MTSRSSPLDPGSRGAGRTTAPTGGGSDRYTQLAGVSTTGWCATSNDGLDLVRRLRFVVPGAGPSNGVLDFAADESDDGVLVFRGTAERGARSDR